MKTRQVRLARWLVTRKWYMWARAKKHALGFRYYDILIMDASPRKLAHINTMLTRCAAKMAWYKNKLKNK